MDKQNNELFISENEKKKIGARLKKWADLYLDSKGDVKNAGINQSQMSRVYNGEINPSFDMLYKLSQNYNLSIDWIMFGRGTMEILPEDHFLNNLEKFEIELFERIIKLPMPIRKDIIININNILNMILVKISENNI